MPSRPDDFNRAAATARTGLAITANARRDRARRLLEASGFDDSRREQRAGAAAQAFAMAGLFAHRTAANGWHRRDRYRWPHGPCGISQWRAVHRYRRAGV